MARRKKRDFWDDVEDDVTLQEESDTARYSAGNQGEYTEYEDERFRFTRCLPIKVIARILLCVAAVVIGLSGYVVYRYVDDRYSNGTYTTSYFDSNGFSREYNDTVERLIQGLKAVEGESGAASDRAAEIISGAMGTYMNFSYYIMDGSGNLVAQSSDDARERIEASNHYLRISNTDNEFSVDAGIPTTGLNKNAWQTALDECTNAYQIYTAVDNTLVSQDAFYDSYMDYQDLTNYFGIARIAGIAAIVVFIILLVFCVMSTGMYRGYAGVRLSWFDKIFTEAALIIILAVAGALIYGLFYLFGHDIRFGIWLKAADGLLLYGVLIRGYFSLVRRIKSGTFITNSIIYKICHGVNMALNHLPKALKIIIILLFLVALNGGLVYALLYMRDFVVGGIPLIFIVAPVVFVIELIAFISCIFGVGDEEDEYGPEEPEEDAGAEESAGSASDDQDWEEVDFGSQIKEASDEAFEDHSSADSGATVENVRRKPVDKTVVLSQNERRKVLDSLGFGETQMLDTKAVREAEKASARRKSEPVPDLEDLSRPGDKTEIMEPLNIAVEDAVKPEYHTEPSIQPEKTETAAVSGAAAVKKEENVSDTVRMAEDMGLVDFIQLNKDVRKLFRLKLKARSIGVTLRAPEKPILLDIDKANAIKVLSILFDNIEKYAEEGSRVYIEMYAQNGKMIYLMKNTIRADLLGDTTNAMGRGLMEAKRIVQSEKGKFINSVEGDTYKVGILLDVASV